jgi:hypothetical protein
MAWLSEKAPVAQWIEQRVPNPRAQVRFLPGALKTAGNESLFGRALSFVGGTEEFTELATAGNSFPIAPLEALHMKSLQLAGLLNRVLHLLQQIGGP